jgi:archaellum component FlaC
MPDDIDRILAGAQLRSKFEGAVSEFGNLLEFVDEYVSSEEKRVESGEVFDEKEMFAMDMIAADATKVEDDLKRIRELILGGLG